MKRIIWTVYLLPVVKKKVISEMYNRYLYIISEENYSTSVDKSL